MTNVTNVEFWKEFFDIYKNLPETWKIKSEIYKNKIIKEKAYLKLLDKYKEIDPNATVDVVKKKINNLRGCYRRELKKQKKSEKSGAGSDDLYVPSLWYFKDLEFLKDQEMQMNGTSSIDLEEINLDDSTADSHQFYCGYWQYGDPATFAFRYVRVDACLLQGYVSQHRNGETTSSVATSPKPKKSSNDLKVQRNEILLKAIEHLEHAKKPSDDASVYSAMWETMFRKLQPRQQAFANKTILEVLYQGDLENLNENSHKMFDKQEMLTNFQSPRMSPTLANTRYLSSQALHGDAFQMPRNKNAENPTAFHFEARTKTPTFPSNYFPTNTQSQYSSDENIPDKSTSNPVRAVTFPKRPPSHTYISPSHPKRPRMCYTPIATTTQSPNYTEENSTNHYPPYRYAVNVQNSRPLQEHNHQLGPEEFQGSYDDNTYNIEFVADAPSQSSEHTREYNSMQDLFSDPNYM